MSLRYLGSVTKEDVDRLVSDSTAEGKTLDYKQELHSRGDKDTKEFLADVSSFANAGGGDILYGITEGKDDDGKNNGIPDAARGLAGVNADHEILRLENQIRDGIEPRVQGIRVEPIEGFADGPCILIRIPQSWTSPHMVSFKGSSRFYVRTSVGKHQLDVSEIRSAFLGSERLADQLSSFRDNRIGQILSENTPVRGISDTLLVFHLIPISGFSQNVALDISSLSDDWTSLGVYDTGSRSYLINFDGLLTYYSYDGGEKIERYCQLFRNGAIETVENRMSPPDRHNNFGVSSSGVEKRLLTHLEKNMQFLKKCEFDPPFFASVALLGVQNKTLATNHQNIDGFEPCVPFDRDIIVFPELRIDDPTKPVEQLLKPVFDLLWQSAGQRSCLRFDGDGNYVPAR